MTDDHRRYPRDPRDLPEPELSPADVAERAVRRIVTAMVIAAAILALAIYSRPGPPRYQAFAADGQIVRIDTRSGTIIACVASDCMRVVRRGQGLRRSLPKQEAARLPAPAVPAPAPAAETAPAAAETVPATR